MLTLTLGLGANIAVFSVVNALLLRPYALPDLDRLVLVRESGHEPGETRFTPADYADLEREAPIFAGLAAFRYQEFSLGGTAGNEGVSGCAVSPGFFEVVGVPPALGRAPSAAEQQQGTSQAVVLRWGYWKRRFGGDPNIIGRTIRINGVGHTVVGVMPAGFTYPLATEIWVPLTLTPQEKAERTESSLHVLARLQRGASLARSGAQLAGFSRDLERRYPQTNAKRTMTLLRLREEQYEFTLPLFLTLQAAAGLLLLLACANLANLLVARMLGRQQEIAVRTALGASRLRLARLFVSETMLVALLAAAAAVVASFWSVDLIRNMVPPEITKYIAGWDDIRVDIRVVIFAAMAAVGVGAFFGLGAAIQSGRVDLNKTLKEGGGRSATDFGGYRLRGGLAVVQMILAMVLLAGAGSMIKGFLHLMSAYRGFEPSQVLTLEVNLPRLKYSDPLRSAGFEEQFLRGAAALPGVESAALATNIPASGVDNGRTFFTIEGRPASSAAEMPAADIQSVSADYFHALRIPVLKGRGISDSDGRTASRVAVISRSMAEIFWPQQDVVGRRLKLGAASAAGPWVTVVGVVGDVRQNWWIPRPAPTLYLPYLQQTERSVYLVARAAGRDPMSLTGAARRIVESLDADAAVTDVQALDGVIADLMAPVRVIGGLMLVFGAIALALSAIGIYGVLAYGVARRTRELGMRMALGAQPADLMRLVIGQALKLSSAGLAVALPLTLLMTRAMASLLFGLALLSAAAIGAFAALVVLVSAAAACVPAWRAMRVDPVVALRNE